MGIIARLIGTVFALFLAASIVPGFAVDGIYSAIIVAVVLGILNLTLRPILLLLTLPLNLLTFGLFSFVVNAGLIWFVASFIEGFTISGFVPALLGGALVTLVQWALHKLI